MLWQNKVNECPLYTTSYRSSLVLQCTLFNALHRALPVPLYSGFRAHIVTCQFLHLVLGGVLGLPPLWAKALSPLNNLIDKIWWHFLGKLAGVIQIEEQ